MTRNPGVVPRVLHLAPPPTLGTPAPPLAAALTAWWTLRGEPWSCSDAAAGEAPQPVRERWIHVEGSGPAILPPIPAGVLPADLHLFGPGLGTALWADALAALPEPVVLHPGDPEPEPILADPDALPIPTFMGLPAVRGGAFRVLFGRGGRSKSTARMIRELLYLHERWAVGHLLFDDADLAAWESAWSSFAEECRWLPFTVEWEGTVGGVRTRGSFGPQRSRRPG